MKAFLASLLCIFLVSMPVESKSFDRGKPGGHEADAYSVLPFARSEGLSDWFHVIHQTIDFPYNTYFNGLRNPPHQDFSWGSYGHRLFFHWGFNGKPWSLPIQECVDRCRWSPSTVESFRQKLMAEQARRNRLVMEQTAKTLGFSMEGTLRGYANGFASLVYDSHLLGDYTTTKQAPLQDLNAVIDDLEFALFDKLKGGDEAKRINKLLESTKTSIPDKTARARRVLEILQRNVPDMILTAQNGYFKTHFQKMGIALR
jgi:hypothetical protein